VFSADLLTPVSVTSASHRAHAFRSPRKCGRRRKIARYTFAGANPEEIFRYGKWRMRSGKPRSYRLGGKDPVTFLRAHMERFRPVRLPGLPPLIAGAIGYFSYDMVG